MDGAPYYPFFIKKFQRSFAGAAQHKADIRNITGLMKSQSFLMDKIALEPFRDCYAFVSDRVRAIRKDVMSQQLKGPQVIEIYEQIARFHMVGLFKRPFAPTYRFQEITMLSATLADLIPLYEAPLPKNAAEFLSYNAMLFMNEQQQNRLLQAVGSDDVFAASTLKILEARKSMDFKRFIELLLSDDTPIGVAIIASLHLDSARADFLRYLVTQKREYSIGDLTTMFYFNSQEETLVFLKEFGIKTCLSEFKDTIVDLKKPENTKLHPSLLDSKFTKSIPNVKNFIINELPVVIHEKLPEPIQEKLNEPIPEPEKEDDDKIPEQILQLIQEQETISDAVERRKLRREKKLQREKELYERKLEEKKQRHLERVKARKIAQKKVELKVANAVLKQSRLTKALKIWIERHKDTQYVKAKILKFKKTPQFLQPDRLYRIETAQTEYFEHIINKVYPSFLQSLQYLQSLSKRNYNVQQIYQICNELIESFKAMLSLAFKGADLDVEIDLPNFSVYGEYMPRSCCINLLKQSARQLADQLGIESQYTFLISEHTTTIPFSDILKPIFDGVLQEAANVVQSRNSIACAEGSVFLNWFELCTEESIKYLQSHYALIPMFLNLI